MPVKDKDIEQWDRYWAYGNLHSFSQVSADNYRGDIAEFWTDRFRRLPKGSRVLDLATGNGAIALLALEESERRGAELDVTGVDLAAIDPITQVKDESLRDKLRRIRFLGRTSAESLPFEDAGVDLVCSQFGIEYSDMSRSVPEVARVLKPGGGLAFIVHHRDSVALAATQGELDQLDFVLNDAKLYLRARGLLKAMAEASGAGRPSPKVQKKQRILNDAMSRLESEARRHTNPRMLAGPARYIQEIFAASDRRSPRELLDWLEEARARVVANKRRLLDMQAAARDREGVSAIEGLIRENGMTINESGPFNLHDGTLLGWCLEAVKDA